MNSTDFKKDSIYKPVITEETIDDGKPNSQKMFYDAFQTARLSLYDIKLDQVELDWLHVTCSGEKYFKAGTQKKIQFGMSCVWNVNSDEIHGIVHAAKTSSSKNFTEILDLNDDQHSLKGFVDLVNTFVTELADAEKAARDEGEREYWAKGGRGMMPGSVTKDYR